MHSSSLEKLKLEGCSSLVEVHQSVGNLKSLIFLNMEGCWSLKILPESIGNVKSLKRLNISGCSQLEKLPEHMGDMESLTELLADGIENEQFLSSIGQLKYVRRLSLRGYNFRQDSPSPTSWVSQISSWLSPSSTYWPPSISSFISASVLCLKRSLPTSFIDWRSVKRLKLPDGGLSDCSTNCVDFRGLSSLKELDLSGNKFSSLPSGIGFLPKLKVLIVQGCNNLESISDLPSSLYTLGASYCKSLERVKIPKQSKKELYIELHESHSLEEIQNIEGQSNIFWNMYVDDHNHSSNNLKKSVVEVLFFSVSLAQEETHTIDTYID